DASDSIPAISTPPTLVRLVLGMCSRRGELTHQPCYPSLILKGAYSCLYATRRRAMDARQAMYHISNRKQWEARINAIHEALSDSMTDDEFYGLTVELCELRDKLDGYYLRREKEGD